jgi:hypothetical protein
VIAQGPLARLGAGWREFPAIAAAGSFLAGFVVWWQYVALPGRTGAGRGAVAGLATGLLAHPATWYLFICLNWALIRLNLRTGPIEGDEPLNPLNGLAGAVVFSVISLVLLGWLTIPVGGLTGALIGRVRRVRPAKGTLDGAGVAR